MPRVIQRETGFAPSPLTDDHALLIGLIITNWTALDVALDEALVAIMRLRQIQVRLITSRLDYREKRDLIRVTAHGGGIPEYALDSLERRLKFIDRCYDIRNVVAHTAWTEGPQQGSIQALRLHTRGKMARAIGIGKYQEDTKYKFSMLDLLRWAKRMMLARRFLLSFLDRHHLLVFEDRRS